MQAGVSVQNVYCFGAFEADLEKRELRRRGLRIKLARQPFDVLSILLESADSVVTREQLRKKLWPDGVFIDFEHGLNRAINQIRQTLGDSRNSPRFIDTLPCIGYRFIAPVQHRNYSPAAMQVTRRRNARLAVLPFEDLNPEADWEYFTDGLVAELITHLGRTLPDKLDVIGRNSTVLYKASGKSLDQIGEELRVDYLLTGCVRSDAGRIRVSVELILAKEQTCVWAESYESQFVDRFSLENDLSAGIASAIAAQLRLRDLTGIARPARINPQIREAYLRGLYHYGKRTEEGLDKSISYFKQAIEGEPSFALAYTGLAESYATLETWGRLCGNQAFPLVRSAVLKALEINPDLAEAHTLLAWVRFAFERDLQESNREFRLAIRLNPNCILAYYYYAFFLASQCNFDQALEANYKAHELDPRSLHVNSIRGWLLFCARRLDEAIELCRQAINFEPYYSPFHVWLAFAYAVNGKINEAITESEIARNSNYSLPKFIHCSGYCYAVRGDTRRAELVVEELAGEKGDQYVSPYWVAAIYAALENRNKAFEWLEKTYEDHSGWAPFLNVDPRFDSLRNEPRFHSLIQRLGLI